MDASYQKYQGQIWMKKITLQGHPKLKLLGMSLVMFQKGKPYSLPDSLFRWWIRSEEMRRSPRSHLPMFRSQWPKWCWDLLDFWSSILQRRVASVTKKLLMCEDVFGLSKTVTGENMHSSIYVYIYIYLRVYIIFKCI